MRVGCQRSGSRLAFELELDSGEVPEGQGQGGSRIQLKRTTFHFELGVDAEFHPDLLALASLTVVLPFARERVDFPLAVSPHFRDELRAAFGLEAVRVDHTLTPRPPGNRVGISYSGGTDSTAAMLLLPDESPLVFCRRTEHPELPNTTPRTRFEGPIAVCERMRALGRELYFVDTDHEHLVGPWSQYPTWISLAAPVIFLADRLDLGALAFGTILGSSYLPAGHCYRPWNPLVSWDRMLAAVGLPIARPVGGVSEVGTSTIVEHSPYRGLPCSCLLDPVRGACMKCSKCLRKELLAAVLRGHRPSPDFWRGFDTPAIRRQFSVSPLYFQHILTYLFCRIGPIDHSFFERVRRGLLATRLETSFLERWYPRSVEQMPLPFRADFLLRKKAWLRDYSVEESWRLEHWNYPSFVLAPPRRRDVALELWQDRGQYARRALKRTPRLERVLRGLWRAVR